MSLVAVREVCMCVSMVFRGDSALQHQQRAGSGVFLCSPADAAEIFSAEKIELAIPVTFFDLK